MLGYLNFTKLINLNSFRVLTMNKIYFIEKNCLGYFVRCDIDITFTIKVLRKFYSYKFCLIKSPLSFPV